MQRIIDSLLLFLSCVLLILDLSKLGFSFDEFLLKDGVLYQKLSYGAEESELLVEVGEYPERSLNLKEVAKPYNSFQIKLEDIEYLMRKGLISSSQGRIIWELLSKRKEELGYSLSNDIYVFSVVPLLYGLSLCWSVVSAYCGLFIERMMYNIKFNYYLFLGVQFLILFLQYMQANYFQLQAALLLPSINIFGCIVLAYRILLHSTKIFGLHKPQFKIQFRKNQTVQTENGEVKPKYVGSIKRALMSLVVTTISYFICLRFSHPFCSFGFFYYLRMTVENTGRALESYSPKVLRPLRDFLGSCTGIGLVLGCHIQGDNFLLLGDIPGCKMNFSVLGHMLGSLLIIESLYNYVFCQQHRLDLQLPKELLDKQKKELLEKTNNELHLVDLWLFPLYLIGITLIYIGFHDHSWILVISGILSLLRTISNFTILFNLVIRQFLEIPLLLLILFSTFLLPKLNDHFVHLIISTESLDSMLISTGTVILRGSTFIILFGCIINKTDFKYKTNSYPRLIIEKDANGQPKVTSIEMDPGIQLLSSILQLLKCYAFTVISIGLVELEPANTSSVIYQLFAAAAYIIPCYRCFTIASHSDQVMLSLLLFFSGFRMTFLGKEFPILFNLSGVLFSSAIYTSNLIDDTPIIPVIFNIGFFFHSALIMSDTFMTMTICMILYVAYNHMSTTRTKIFSTNFDMIWLFVTFVVLILLLISLGVISYNTAYKTTKNIFLNYFPNFYESVYIQDFKLSETTFIKQFFPELITFFGQHIS